MASMSCGMGSLKLNSSLIDGVSMLAGWARSRQTAVCKDC